MNSLEFKLTGSTLEDVMNEAKQIAEEYFGTDVELVYRTYATTHYVGEYKVQVNVHIKNAWDEVDF